MNRMQTNVAKRADKALLKTRILRVPRDEKSKYRTEKLTRTICQKSGGCVTIGKVSSGKASKTAFFYDNLNVCVSCTQAGNSSISPFSETNRS
jgi:hypothetical protein